MLQMARMKKDWNQKIGPTFSSINAMPVKIDHQKIVMVTAPWFNMFDLFFLIL